MFSRVLVGSVMCACAVGVVHADDKAMPSVDEVIAKYIDAIGGQKALDSIKSLHMTGKSVFGGGMEAPLTIDVKRPGQVRVEFTFQGMTGTQAFDGKTGWFIMPFMGKTDPEKMPPDMVKQIRQQAEIEGPLINYKKKGHKVEMDGEDEVEGSPVYKIKVTRADGDVEFYLLDKELYIPLAQKGTRDFQGTPIDYQITFGNYKKVAGVLMPYSIDQKANGGMGGGNTVTFEKIEVNTDIPNSRFAMPEKKPDKPEADEKSD